MSLAPSDHSFQGVCSAQPTFSDAKPGGRQQWPCEQLLRQQRSTLDQLPSVGVADDVTTPGLLGISGLGWKRLKIMLTYVNLSSSTYLVTPEIRFDSKMFFLNRFDNLLDGTAKENPLYSFGVVWMFPRTRIDSGNVSKMPETWQRHLLRPEHERLLFFFWNT